MSPVAVAFAPGSATLPSSELPALKAVATRRGTASLAVIGYGEARTNDPEAQSAALALGLSRAQAIAAALAADGVPANALQVDAEASGRGGVVHALN
jgi:outer membrane protein OmpA-like peptidoglycan-associated protein